MSRSKELYSKVIKIKPITMKNYIFLVLLFIALGMNNAFAQSSDIDWKYIVVRDDVVRPSMTVYYEASLSDLSLFLTENQIQSVKYVTQLQDNYHYTHITPLKDLNEIEGGLRAFIRGDKRSAEFDLIWSDLNETIESYSFYVVKYEPELSYVPDGKVWLEEAPYRKWNYYYFYPGTENEVENIVKAWKNLYEDKGLKHGFRVFRGVTGIEQPVIIFTTWAASPLEYHANLQDNIDLLENEGALLWMAMMELVRKVETVEGWYLPQYSYMPDEKD